MNDSEADINNRQVMSPLNYTSPSLTVWRFLHVEVDTMAPCPETGSEKNTVDGHITSIESDANGTVAEKVFLSVNLKTGLDPIDESLNFDTQGLMYGRFGDGGRITIGDTITNGLAGNGFTYVLRFDTWGGINLPALVHKQGQQDINGKVINWQGNIFKLANTTGTLNDVYIGGDFFITGVLMHIEQVDPINNSITVSAPANIPFVMHDDDNDNRSMAISLSEMDIVYPQVYYLPIYDNGGVPNVNNTIPFILNEDYDGGRLDPLAQQDSANNACDGFWIAYVSSAYQGMPTEDADCNQEVVTGGCNWSPNVSNEVVAAGGKAAWIFVESINDALAQGECNNCHLGRVVVHEIGHALGLGELNDDTIMSSKSFLPSGTGFADIHIHLLRSRVHSPPGIIK
ncbi:hypothetical protein HY772_04555 [Candidatus Woesearchaeota archaeon]|nr:hypothetical protein [Candidatus Woesearchaeota archaeon]